MTRKQRRKIERLREEMYAHKRKFMRSFKPLGRTQLTDDECHALYQHVYGDTVEKHYERKIKMIKEATV